MRLYNFSAESQSLQSELHTNPSPDGNPTELIHNVPLPSVVALGDVPKTTMVVSPEDARLMAGVVQDVLPGLAHNLADKSSDANNPIVLKGTYAVQAQQALGAISLEQLRSADDTEPVISTEAARTALLREAIADSLAVVVVSTGVAIPAEPEAESTLEALGLPAHDFVLEEASLTTRAVVGAVNGVKKRHTHDFGILKSVWGRVWHSFRPKAPSSV